jgi:hypothetical protein
MIQIKQSLDCRRQKWRMSKTRHGLHHRIAGIATVILSVILTASVLYSIWT